MMTPVYSLMWCKEKHFHHECGSVLAKLREAAKPPLLESFRTRYVLRGLIQIWSYSLRNWPRWTSKVLPHLNSHSRTKWFYCITFASCLGLSLDCVVICPVRCALTGRKSTTLITCFLRERLIWIKPLWCTEWLCGYCDYQGDRFQTMASTSVSAVDGSHPELITV